MKPLSHARQLSLFSNSFEISSTRAARLLNTSPDTVMRLIEEGRLEAYRLRDGGWWKVSYDSVVAYRNKIRNDFALASSLKPQFSADDADDALVR